MAIIPGASDVPQDSGSVTADGVTLFLSGDVMLGRGIDQILPHAGDPRIYEPHASSATAYVELAESANGPIPRPVDFSYVWGDALAALEDARPSVRIVNLETSVTRSGRYVPKGINYKMNPDNIACLSVAKPDCCVLANNHILDWERSGLVETLDTLKKAGIRYAGAGRDAAEAEAPAIIELMASGRVLIFAFGSPTSGIPRDWAAGENRPGISLLERVSPRSIDRILRRVQATRRRGDLLVASIHWGENWGYEIARWQREFAHRLIDEGEFGIVHGHSAHHPKAIELYRQRLILYGCGDFLDDYEGIGGYERFRSDLAVMYLPRLSLLDGRLLELRLIPFQIRKFRLNRSVKDDAAWLRDTLEGESARLGARVTLNDDNTLMVAPR